MQQCGNYGTSKYPVLISRREEYREVLSPTYFITKNYEKNNSRLLSIWNTTTESIKILIQGILFGVITVEPLSDPIDLNNRTMCIKFNSNESPYNELIFKFLIANGQDSVSFGISNEKIYGIVSGTKFHECDIAEKYSLMFRAMSLFNVQDEIDRINKELISLKIKKIAVGLQQIKNILNQS
jgi:hypothetical protein